MREPIDIKKLEAIRERMLLSVVTVATLAGVHRVTYYSWVRGDRNPRHTHEEKLRRALAKMGAVIRDFQWPTEEIRKMGDRERQQRFLDLAARY
jgi:predicted transcriptional regulator